MEDEDEGNRCALKRNLRSKGRWQAQTASQGDSSNRHRIEISPSVVLTPHSLRPLMPRNVGTGFSKEVGASECWAKFGKGNRSTASIGSAYVDRRRSLLEALVLFLPCTPGASDWRGGRPTVRLQDTIYAPRHTSVFTRKCHALVEPISIFSPERSSSYHLT